MQIKYIVNILLYTIIKGIIYTKEKILTATNIIKKY